METNSNSIPTPTPSLITEDPSRILKVGYFWDIENCGVPGSFALEAIERVRKVVRSKFESEGTWIAIRESCFNCYTDVAQTPTATRTAIQRAGAAAVDVPDRKEGASDRALLYGVDQFERNMRPPAAVVLISGDVDFIPKLSGLKNQAGYRIVVIHNPQARIELKKVADYAIEWSEILESLEGWDPEKNLKMKNQKAQAQQNKSTSSTIPSTRSETNKNITTSTYKSNPNVKEEFKERAITSTGPTTCVLCGLKFINRNGLNRHNQILHDVGKMSASSKPFVPFKTSIK